MKQDEVLNDIINYLEALGIQGLTVAKTTDLSQQRQQNMLAVSVQKCDKLNVLVDDYQLQVRVVLDSYITQDDSGQGTFFKTTCEAVQGALKTLQVSDFSTTSKVVGVVYNGCTGTIQAESNMMTYSLSIFVSY